MNNYELKHYLSSYDVQVVCSDDLPAVAKKHQFWIVNTDECGGKGLHWVVFDSRIQSVTSSLCGHYCIYFILQRIKGRSMNNIVHDFYDLNTHANDRLVSDFINDMY